MWKVLKKKGLFLFVVFRTTNKESSYGFKT